MQTLLGKSGFVSIVAQEISSGIDRALGYWLGRIELVALDRSMTSMQRIQAIEHILREYKEISGEGFDCASA